jgi:membrane-bound serine protease (ClpP class)
MAWKRGRRRPAVAARPMREEVMVKASDHAAGGQGPLRRLARSIAALLLLFCMAGPARAQTESPVFLIEISGAIGVATTRQLSRAIERAQADRAAVLIVRLDTPGGLVSSTRELIKQMIASPVPIVIYVAPSGAQAASAGTFIVYAAHIAAMAPGTNLGAATPIEIGAPGLPQPRREPAKDDKSSGPQTETTAQRKAINDVVALLRSLAQLRGRNVEFAEKAVREAATLTAEEAAKQGVVDVMATGIEDLLVQIDGRKVTAGGTERTLATRGVKPVTIEPDLRTRLLSVISNPNVAFILLMIGFYGIILEFWNPGTFVPGVVGGISLVLALIALSALPLNYGALGLMVLGIGLMMGEAFTPGIGILGIGGVMAFAVGAYFLFEGAGSDIDMAVSLPVIISMTATTALLTFGVVAAAVQARRRVAVTGAEQILGAQARVVAWRGNSGQVRVLGEIWSARSGQTLERDQVVRVVGRDGLTLVVQP